MTNDYLRNDDATVDIPISSWRLCEQHKGAHSPCWSCLRLEAIKLVKIMDENNQAVDGSIWRMAFMDWMNLSVKDLE